MWHLPSLPSASQVAIGVGGILLGLAALASVAMLAFLFLLTPRDDASSAEPFGDVPHLPHHFDDWRPR